MSNLRDGGKPPLLSKAVILVRDSLARGDGRRARELFEKLEVPSRLEPAFIEHLALLRDSGQAETAYHLSLEALENFPMQSRKTSPQQRELIELESLRSLIRMGAPREAASRLRMGRWSAEVQKSRVYQMTAINSHVVLWQYREALPLIESLLQKKMISVYDERLLITTQISAWVFIGELNRAREIFWETIEDLSFNQSWILMRRLLEVGAQLYWELNDVDGLERVLSTARDFFGQHPDLGGPTAEFFVVRWQAMLGTCIGQELSEEKRADFESRIATTRARAVELKSGEAIRDADLLAVLMLRDQRKLERLYFVSAFPSFREYLARMAMRLGLEIPKQAILEIGTKESEGEDSQSAAMTFVLEKGEFSHGGHLRSGSVSFRILSALLRDAYRPLRTAELYHEIFPNQVYDPFASDRRVQQAIRRLKMELLAMGVPFALQAHAGGYVIDPRGTRLNVLVSQEWIGCDGIDRAFVVELIKLRQRFKTDSFDIRFASEALQLPQRTTQLILHRMTSEGLISRKGRGRATRYSS